MKTYAKPFVALASAAILLFGALCQTSHAQATIAGTNTAALADDNGSGTTAPPEALTVTTWVTYTSGANPYYTYNYIINNPSGDVILGGAQNGQPESVGNFSVNFDATVAGAYVPFSEVGSLLPDDHGYDGASGIRWVITPVNPGSSSATLSFESDLPPVLGDANASDSGNAPSPWASNPDGQQVFVPSVVPEPTTTALLVGFAMLLPFRFTFIKKTQGKV